MKKLFLSIFVSCICVSSIAQIVESPIKIMNGFEAYLTATPKSFSYNNVPILHVVNNDNNGTTKISIYDDEFTEIKTIKHTKEIAKIVFYDWDNDNIMYEDQGFELSQTLFNTDKKYEFIEVVRDNTTEDIKAFNIISEDGVVLQSLIVEEEFYYYDWVDIIKINNKYYLGISYEDDEYISYTRFYKINKETETLIKSATIEGMKVTPIIAERTQDITIELTESCEAKEIVITNINGKVVSRIPISKGQKQVTINAASIGQGMSIINSRGGKRYEKGHKIIVR